MHALGHQYDLFVSYARVDNEPLPGADKGWVSTLVDNISALLAMALGRRDAFSVWFDVQGGVHGYNNLQGHIPQEVRRSALYLAILSPGYLSSPWCLEELRVFLEANRHDLADRLFVVERAPLNDSEIVPDALAGLRGYRFWYLDENRQPRTYAVPTPFPAERDYYRQSEDLARDLASKLRQMRRNSIDAAALRLQDPKSAVLLAEVTDDLGPRRDEVARFLRQAGVSVLPTGAYALDSAQLNELMGRDLAQSKVFVQLLGPFPYRRRAHATDGLGWLQLAAARRQGVPVLQWRHPDVNLDGVRTGRHRELLSLDTVQAVPLEHFKSSIIEAVRYVSPMAKTISAPFVFINADATDLDLAYGIARELGDSVDIELPLVDPEAGPEEIQEHVASNLVRCDGLAIIYGRSPPSWFGRQTQLYRKLAPQRQAPLRVHAMVDASPEGKPPPPSKPPGMRIIDGRHGVATAATALRLALSG